MTGMENTTRMYFRLQLALSDGTTHKARTWKKRRLLKKIRTIEWNAASLEVVYYKNGLPIGSNEGAYTNTHDLLAALDAFTDSEVIA